MFDSSSWFVNVSCDQCLQILQLTFWNVHEPEQGHLLVLEGLPQLKLKLGLMEFEYTANYTKIQSTLHSQAQDVSVPSVVTDPAAIPDDSFRVAMTASMDTSGRLLLGMVSGGPIGFVVHSIFEISYALNFKMFNGLISNFSSWCYGAGSSREFSGFSTAHHFEAVEGILNRASKFLPALMEFSVHDVLENATIRTGLRPYGQFLWDLLILVENHGQTSSICIMSHPGLVICLALLRFATAAVLGGVPLIGPVPELGGLLLATGHEGSGLCMVCFLSHPCARILCASIPYIFHK
jgi:hypothetical protein